MSHARDWNRCKHPLLSLVTVEKWSMLSFCSGDIYCFSTQGIFKLLIIVTISQHVVCIVRVLGFYRAVATSPICLAGEPCAYCEIIIEFVFQLFINM